MNIIILFVIICLAVYMINWAADAFYDPYDIDELEKVLIAEEEATKDEI